MRSTKSDTKKLSTGSVLFSLGLRPFFLFGVIWVVVAMVLWLLALAGAIDLPTRFDPVSWHAHAFLFGYMGAVLAGFLLTAVPNWTGRPPLAGAPLAALFWLWVAGRVAVLTSALTSALAPVVVDLAFPAVLGGYILREIIAGKNWRNLIVLGMLTIFAAANLIFHLEALTGQATAFGLRLGLATVVMMISVIGGRIVPSFTKNWLFKQDKDARPAPPMQRYDKLTLMFSVATLSAWVVWPDDRLSGAFLLVMGVLHAIRLARWQGHRTLAEPLIFVLHAAYAFVPLGAIALGLDILTGSHATVATQHLWMAGAIGAMTLAVMTRATLGHTGRALHADTMTVVIYLALLGSVVTRLVAVFLPGMIHASGAFWILAFGGFALIYGPMLLRPPLGDAT
ncbi:MAG: NnrS family protein [Pseudomonadota bacterium]